MSANSIERIQRLSKRFRLLFAVLMVLIPALDLLFWVSFNRLPEGFGAGLPAAAHQDLPPVFLALAFLVSLIPVSVALYGLVMLSRLFRLYEHAIVFADENVRLFRRLGYTVIAWVFANVLFTSLISVVITHGDPAGQPTMTVGFDVSDVSALIMGGIVVLVASVMNEGRKLQNEQALTV